MSAVQPRPEAVESAGPAPAGVVVAPDGPVLIGFAHSLAAPETAWSLLAAGFPVVAFARRGTRPALRRSKAVRIVEITDPAADLERAILDVREHLLTGGYRAVMPLDDAAIWLCSAATDLGSEVPVAGPTGLAAGFALDKHQQVIAAERAGFAVAPTRFIDSVDELLSLSEFPVVVKASRAIAKRGRVLVRPKSYVCGSRSEVESIARSWDPVDTLLAQPLLSGSGEGLFGIAGSNGLMAVSAHRRIRMMNPHGSGSSACASTPVDPALVAAGERMLAALDWRGMFMLEFLRDTDGTPWFMELNGRPWGSMALARRSGLEYPAWAVRRLRDDTFEPPDVPFAGEVICRHLGRELNHLLLVIRGPQSSGVTSWPSLYQSARAVFRFRRNEYFYNWQRGESAVFLSETLTTVTEQVRQAFKR